MRYAQRVSKLKDQLDADDRIILVRVKVERAKKHLRDLAAEILTLQHTTILTPDPSTGVAPHPISLLHPNKFQRVPTLSFEVVAIAGDVVHNLRAALDHLAKQLVLVGLREAPPFPPLNERSLGRSNFPLRRLLPSTNPTKLEK